MPRKEDKPMLWRDLAGRLYGLAHWIDKVYDPAERVDETGPPAQELCRLLLDVTGEPPDLRPLQGTGRLGDREATVRPTGGAPPRRTEDGG